MAARALAFFVIMCYGVLGVSVTRSTHPERTSSSGKTSSPSGATVADTRANPEIERLLNALEGTWTITDVLSPDAKSPKGKTGQGTIVWRPGPGRFSVIEEFRSKQGDEDVSGFGAMWWDPSALGYHTIWCDSTNPGGCIDFKNVARWEGQNLVLQEDYEVNSKKFTFKEVFGEITADAFTQTLYGAEAGHPLKVDEVIHASRLKTATRS